MFRRRMQRKSGGLLRRRKAGHIYLKVDGPSAAVPSTLKRPTDCRYPSTPQGSASAHHLATRAPYPAMQQDHRCAPRRPLHRLKDVNCRSRGLQAETAMTYWLHWILFDPQQRVRSTHLEALSRRFTMA